MAIPDPIRQGLASGWKVVDASRLEGDTSFEADVAIVGTGAGGGVAAEILTAAGLSVVMIEEGPLASSTDFRMLESEAYPALYQESAARKTGDKTINILQGRCVGGGTTVNWTSSFRTPPGTLAHWTDHFGLAGFDAVAMAPWFDRMEERLGIAPWPFPPNENNDLLRRGAQRLGIPTGFIRRNVRGCWNLGYCGTGCPTNAKQSMLVTTIPAALAHGAALFTRTRAIRFLAGDDRVRVLECVAMDAGGVDPTGRRITIRARAFVCAAGAIGTPALLLRSRLPDPESLVGQRTFLHPSAVSAARMPAVVDGHAGAPQSVYSDHFLDSVPIAGPLGFKLEAPPIHPILAATTLQGYGGAHAERMTSLRHMHVLIALLRDGFHPDSQGGRVRLRSDGSPVLDYPLNRVVFDALRRALLAMAEIQFAGGATQVLPVHEDATGYGSWSEARVAIEALDFSPMRVRVVSAHVMGGAPLGPDRRRSVVDLSGRHHHVENLYVFDGSLFPTSIGANPQLSIYALVARLASGLATALRR